MGRSKFIRSSRGSALLVAILLPVLLGFAALVVDVGYLYSVHSQLQNAADAAALAAVVELDGTGNGAKQARQAAQSFGAEHTADGRQVAIDRYYDIALGYWDAARRRFTPSRRVADLNAVRVIARQTERSHGPVRLFLARIFGKETADVGAQAIAVQSGAGQGCSIPLVLHEAALRSRNGRLQCNAPISLNSGDGGEVFYSSLDSYPPTPGRLREILGARNSCKQIQVGDTIRLANNTNILGQFGHVVGFQGIVPVVADNPQSLRRGEGEVIGFATVKIVGPGNGGPPDNSGDGGAPPNRPLQIQLLCDQDIGAPAGGEYFGTNLRPLLVL